MSRHLNYEFRSPICHEGHCRMLAATVMEGCSEHDARVRFGRQDDKSTAVRRVLNPLDDLPADTVLSLCLLRRFKKPHRQFIVDVTAYVDD